MKKVLFIIVCFFSLFLLGSCSREEALDEIEDYKITVDQKDDGSLDMHYEIKWKVLSDKVPLDWVIIGIPNDNIDTLVNLSDDVKEVYIYDDEYIRCDLKSLAYKNDIVTFDFKFHLLKLYTYDSKTINYDFTPGWFDDIEVKKIEVLWNKNNVKKSNADSFVGDYLLWEKNLKKGEKININVSYDKALYPNLILNKDNAIIPIVICVAVFVVMFITIFVIAFIKTNKNCYEVYRGFSGEDFSRFPTWYYCLFYNSGRNKTGNRINPPSSNNTSHCACACACACAGGGRAGCSRKDFYNPKIKSSEFIKKLEDQNE